MPGGQLDGAVVAAAVVRVGATVELLAMLWTVLAVSDVAAMVAGYGFVGGYAAVVAVVDDVVADVVVVAVADVGAWRQFVLGATT